VQTASNYIRTGRPAQAITNSLPQPPKHAVTSWQACSLRIGFPFAPISRSEVSQSWTGLISNPTRGLPSTLIHSSTGLQRNSDSVARDDTDGWNNVCSRYEALKRALAACNLSVRFSALLASEAKNSEPLCIRLDIHQVGGEEGSLINSVYSIVDTILAAQKSVRKEETQ
jgi:hypothetical protein